LLSISDKCQKAMAIFGQVDEFLDHKGTKVAKNIDIVTVIVVVCDTLLQPNRNDPLVLPEQGWVARS